MKMNFKKFIALGMVILSGGIMAACGSQNSQKSSTNGSQQSSQIDQNKGGQNNKSAKDLANLNYQSGQPAYININDGKSTLNPDDWKTNHVVYSNLDSLNRTSTGNTAYLNSQNVANDSLRSTQNIKPTGWHQKFINNAAIINRGHEIAYSLSKGISVNGKYEPGVQSGDQNNPKNLFTQTAFSNQKVQTIYESKVRNALRNGKKVIYQVQPIFRNDELMARGVHLQAISTDKSVNFNVYLYNVQPGIQFDYATGRSKIDRSMNVPTPANAPTFNDHRRSGNQSYNNYNNNYERPYHRHHYVRDAIIAGAVHHAVKKHYEHKYEHRAYHEEYQPRHYHYHYRPSYHSYHFSHHHF